MDNKLEVATPFSPKDLEDLRQAKSLLEKPSLAARLTSALGAPIEQGFALLPERWADSVNVAVNSALEKALRVAVKSLGSKQGSARERAHRLAAMASGAGGGAFGLAGLFVELPLSTTIMLRSIAEIAREEGEDLRSAATQVACLEVFALGGPSQADNAAETGYFAVRSILASAVRDAARYVAQKQGIETGAPAIVRLIAAVSTRFGVVVSEKAAAMAVPALGAAGGAIVNSLFIKHFQDMARGHFIVRRLERGFGHDEVKRAYEQLTVA